MVKLHFAQMQNIGVFPTFATDLVSLDFYTTGFHRKIRIEGRRGEIPLDYFTLIFLFYDS